jgi:uncharacterized protein YfaS (alpha-2-macroglobulin family)
VAKSTSNVTGKTQTFNVSAPYTGTYYVVVKRETETTGSGNFTLTSSGPAAVSATVHLVLTENPTQATYTRGQSVTFTVNVLNQLSRRLNSTLTLTVTGPRGYYYFDSQTVNVTADSVGEYSFTWSVPAVAGTYAAEVSLVPPQLTAYDAAWLKIV